MSSEFGGQGHISAFQMKNNVQMYLMFRYKGKENSEINDSKQKYSYLIKFWYLLYMYYKAVLNFEIQLVIFPKYYLFNTIFSIMHYLAISENIKNC
jgi:hypothetical protein